jgi:hypothetical protein
MTLSKADKLSEVRRRRSATRSAILAALPDIPSTSGSGGSGGVSDRTGRLGCLVAEGADQAYKDLALLTDLEWASRTVGLTEHQLDQWLALCDRWAPTEERRKHLEAGLRAAAGDNLNRTGDLRNCQSCKRIPGRLQEPHKKGLCWACNDLLETIRSNFVTDIDVPPLRLLEIRVERGRVMPADINRVMHGTQRREQLT